MVIIMTPIICFSQVDEQSIKNTISISEQTRKDVANKITERMPANSLDNWNDFEKVMSDDSDWTNELDNMIEEYK